MKNVGSMLKLAACAVALMAGAGCSTLADLKANGFAADIEANAATLNEAHTRAMTAVIAKNVLRARDRWPTNYTTLSGIRSNPTIATGGKTTLGPLGLGNARLPFANSAAELSRNETANAEFSVNPFSNNDKSQSLLQPIDPRVFESYWSGGWPKEMLMWLFVDSITWADGEGAPFDANKPWFIEGDENGPIDGGANATQYAAFLALIERGRRGELDFRPLDPDPLDFRRCAPVDMAYLTKAFGVRENEGVAAMVAAVEAMSARKLVYARDSRAAAGATVQPADSEGRRLLLCDPAEKRWGFVDRATQQPVAAIRTRSFDDMVYFLGEMLRRGDDQTPGLLGDVILFRVSTRPEGGAYASRVEHAGDTYFIAPQRRPGDQPPGAPKDFTGNVLSLLNQLYLLAQSDEFLRAPESRLR